MWSAGLVMTPPVFNLIPQAQAGSENRPDIFVAKGKNIEPTVDAVIQKLGQMSSLVKPGDKVVIKPNIGWDRTVDQAANTHPLVVKRLAQLCLDAGAGKVLIFDRTCNESRRCYTNSGIKDAVKEIGDRRVRLDHIDDRKFVPVTIKNALLLEQWTFYKDALEADVYINVPVAKHHGLSRLSLGLKNTMGVIGGGRGRLHFRLGPKLADLNQVIRSNLTIIDATRILIRNGPQGGRLSDVRKIDTIIGSLDPVAADAYATTLFGLKPKDIDSTVKAHQAGLGQMNLDLCNIYQFTV